MKTKRLTPFFTGIFLLLLNFANAQSITLPYFTGWDNPAEKTGWTQYRTGYQSTYSWGNNTMLSHDYNVGGAPTQTVVDWYVSPALDCITTSTMTMKVRTGGFSQPTVDNCEVYFSATARDPAMGTYTLVGNLSYMKPQYQWIDTAIVIPHTSASGYIAFKYKTIGAAWSTYNIDSLTVKRTPAPSTVDISENSTIISGIGPNPFSLVTTINFTTPLKNAEVCIYSVSGKLMRKQVVSGTQVQVEKQDMSPGVYFFEVIQGNRQPAKGKILVTGE